MILNVTMKMNLKISTLKYTGRFKILLKNGIDLSKYYFCQYLQSCDGKNDDIGYGHNTDEDVFFTVIWHNGKLEQIGLNKD